MLEGVNPLIASDLKEPYAGRERGHGNDLVFAERERGGWREAGQSLAP